MTTESHDDRERATRADLEKKLANITAALIEAEQHHRAAMVAADRRLAEHKAHYDVEMARAAATWDMVDEQLRAAAAEVERARQNHASARAAAEDAAGRERAVQAKLEQEADTRRHVEGLLAQEVSARESKVADLERLAKREADLSASLDDLTTRHNDIERQLAATEEAFQGATTRATEERLAASKRAAEREAEFNRLLQQERATRVDLERTITQSEAALRAARQQHEEAGAAARELTERQAHVERTASATAADRDRLAERVDKAERALDQARREYETAAADIERVKAREADLVAKLAKVEAARDAFERQLADAATVIQDDARCEADLRDQIERDRGTRARLEQDIADAAAATRDAKQQHEAALAQAVNELSERQAKFDGEFSKVTAERDRLGQRVRDAEVALDLMHRDCESAAADVVRVTQREADIRAQLTDVQAARDTLERELGDARNAIRHASEREAQLGEELRQQRETRAALERTLVDAEAALREAQQRHDTATAAAAHEFAEQRAHTDRQLSEARAECDRAIAQLTEIETTREDLERQLADAAGAMADEIDARTMAEQALSEAREASLDAERSAREEIEALQASAREQQAQFDARFAHEQLEHKNRLADMEAAHRTLALERDSLRQSVAALEERMVPELRKQLDESRAERDRLFEHAGIAMFRCTPEGALVQANRACTTLVGRRTIDELQGLDFAAAIFEAPNVFSWLIERCIGSRGKESIETTWRRKDGGRLFVRLSARPVADVVEIVAEDLTRVRVLQERLGQANRMEAVGRLASEVAVTCSNLLDEIHQRGREWLQTLGENTDARGQGERLFEEVGRAGGFLQQVAECSNEQARTPMLVDLNTLIQDLEPVLKRVAGGDVEIQLRDTSPSLNVDVGTEQVERMLVNVASYGRRRMPFGGRLRIELGTSVVDRRFAAKHPNVRLGLHALITVTEIRRTAAATETPPPGVASRPSVDFSTLRELVGQCGGHLWMKVQPQGDMVAKIRLPLSMPAEQAQPRPVARSNRKRATARVQS
ncbi:MAG TPA: PAS domain S-box protein [Vicinamibacterales bacterium]|nr:PAS domain S-box protein [Vicinamibacterales bacterium]